MTRRGLIERLLAVPFLGLAGAAQASPAREGDKFDLHEAIEAEVEKWGAKGYRAVGVVLNPNDIREYLSRHTLGVRFTGYEPGNWDTAHGTIPSESSALADRHHPRLKLEKVELRAGCDLSTFDRIIREHYIAPLREHFPQYSPLAERIRTHRNTA